MSAISPTPEQWPFDMPFVIRKARLRNKGLDGLYALATAMREEGWDAFVEVRNACFMAWERGTIGSPKRQIELVKEQQQHMLSMGDLKLGLYLDDDWQKILERAYLDIREGMSPSVYDVSVFYDKVLAKPDYRNADPDLVVRIREAMHMQPSRGPKIKPARIEMNEASGPDGMGEDSDLQRLLQERTNRLYLDLPTQAREGSDNIAQWLALGIVDIGLPTNLLERSILATGHPGSEGVIEARRSGIALKNPDLFLAIGYPDQWSGLSTYEVELFGRDAPHIVAGATHDATADLHKNAGTIRTLYGERIRKADIITSRLSEEIFNAQTRNRPGMGNGSPRGPRL